LGNGAGVALGVGGGSTFAIGGGGGGGGGFTWISWIGIGSSFSGGVAIHAIAKSAPITDTCAAIATALASVRRQPFLGSGNAIPGKAIFGARPERAASPMRKSRSGEGRPTRRRIASVEVLIALSRQPSVPASLVLIEPASHLGVAATAQLARVLRRHGLDLRSRAPRVESYLWRLGLRPDFRFTA
jgi:hypothetical protein